MIVLQELFDEVSEVYSDYMDTTIDRDDYDLYSEVQNTRKVFAEQFDLCEV